MISATARENRQHVISCVYIYRGELIEGEIEGEKHNDESWREYHRYKTRILDLMRLRIVERDFTTDLAR